MKRRPDDRTKTTNATTTTTMAEGGQGENSLAVSLGKTLLRTSALRLLLLLSLLDATDAVMIPSQDFIRNHLGEMRDLTGESSPPS